VTEPIAELLAKVAEQCEDAAAIERLAKAIEDLTEVMRAIPQQQYVPYPVYPQYPGWQQYPVIYDSGTGDVQFKVKVTGSYCGDDLVATMAEGLAKHSRRAARRGSFAQ
jgi:hypothetical protein